MQFITVHANGAYARAIMAITEIGEGYNCLGLYNT